jgi:type IV secretion system protein VirB2
MSNRFILTSMLLLTALFVTEPAFATSSAGGGLPFDSWLTKVSNSITGPFAFTVSVVGIVAAGAMLIFGGDMSGFMKTLIFIVLVLSFVIAGKNTLSTLTGTSAVITKSVHIEPTKGA